MMLLTNFRPLEGALKGPRAVYGPQTTIKPSFFPSLLPHISRLAEIHLAPGAPSPPSRTYGPKGIFGRKRKKVSAAD